MNHAPLNRLTGSSDGMMWRQNADHEQKGETGDVASRQFFPNADGRFAAAHLREAGADMSRLAEIIAPFDSQRAFTRHYQP